MPKTEEKPAFEYPLLYEFRAVTKKIPDVRNLTRQVVESIVGELPDDAASERDSSGGKYASVHVRCMLTSEEQRRSVYLRLRAESWVILTL
jgi:putative lipoic acid-binding regulatory protein